MGGMLGVWTLSLISYKIFLQRIYKEDSLSHNSQKFFILYFFIFKIISKNEPGGGLISKSAYLKNKNLKFLTKFLSKILWRTRLSIVI